MSATTPVNESRRLQTLRDYHIVDTPPEAAFERIAGLAARLLNMPMAMVSFVTEDRQWVKASHGIDLGLVSRETSFCARAILDTQVLVTEDARLDSRFEQNRLVTGPPFIRFYAGAPLRAPNGENLGSMCVLDSKPRSFSPKQQATLEDLAAIVVDELELRRALRTNARLVVAINSSTSGVVVTDPNLPNHPIVFANPGFYETTLFTPEEVIGFNCRFLQGAETDPKQVQEIREAIAERRSYSGILLNYRKDGTPFLNELIINPVFDEYGKLVNFVGLQNDVTARESAKMYLEQQVAERTAELGDSQIEILTRLARAAEYRDDDTGQHTQRVAHTSALLAQVMGMSESEVEIIRLAAPLHDVGKIGVSDLILLKPGKLTDDEFAIMKSHAALGAALLSNGHSDVVQAAERIAGSHHERWDGRGYPNRLAGEQIPLEGRILAVADVFDALTHARPYKEAWAVEEAIAEILRQSGTQFDPAVVEAFLQLPHHELV